MSAPQRSEVISCCIKRTEHASVSAVATTRVNPLQRTWHGRFFFEDVVIGESLRAGPYVIAEREMLEFAATWDPLPILEPSRDATDAAAPPSF